VAAADAEGQGASHAEGGTPLPAGAGAPAGPSSTPTPPDPPTPIPTPSSSSAPAAAAADVADDAAASQAGSQGPQAASHLSASQAPRPSLPGRSWAHELSELRALLGSPAVARSGVQGGGSGVGGAGASGRGLGGDGGGGGGGGGSAARQLLPHTRGREWLWWKGGGSGGVGVVGRPWLQSPGSCWWDDGVWSLQVGGRQQQQRVRTPCASLFPGEGVLHGGHKHARGKDVGAG